MPSSLVETFLRQVDKAEPNQCWLWTGVLNKGYGQLTMGHRSYRAHRVSKELVDGPIPAGLEIDHLCRNKACVNPAHLEIVTRKENTRRNPCHVSKREAAKTHCPQGHPYDEANTYRTSGGKRICRTCNRSSVLRRYHAKKAGVI